MNYPALSLRYGQVFSVTFCLFFFVDLIFAEPIISDPLRVIEEQIAKDEKRFGRGERNELYGARWLVPGTNYAKIFIYHDGPLLLAQWIGVTLPGFRSGKAQAHRQVEFVSATIPFAYQAEGNFKGGTITLSIYVPHPKYVPMAELGVIKELAKLTPKGDPTVGSRVISLPGEYQATLFVSERGGCSALVRLPHQTYVRAVDPQCSRSKALEAFIKLLDYERLVSKLDS